MKLKLSELRNLVGNVLLENDLSRRQMKLSSVNGEDRFSVFLSKVREGSEFQLRRGESMMSVRISMERGNEPLLRALRAKDPDAYLQAFADCCGGRGVKCRTKSGEVHYIKNPRELIKSEEFGGKGTGYFLERETEQMKSILERIQSLAPVRLIVRSNDGGEVAFDGVSALEKLNNNSKADVSLVDSEGKEVGRLSLKWSEEPVQMHQWGGVHHILDDEEVSSFVSSLKRRSRSSLSGSSFTRELQSDDVKLDSIFGCDRDDEGIDCTDMEVDAVVAGKDISLELQDDGSLLLTAQNVWLKGEIPAGEWEPALWTVFNKSDKQRGASYGLPGVRVMIGPSDWRKNNVEEI